MAALVLCVLGIQSNDLSKLRARQLTLTKTEIERDVTDKADRIALWKTTPTFGFDNLISNLTLIDFIQYFGDEPVRKINGYGLALPYFDLILEKDPKFFVAYFHLSVAGNIYNAQPEKSMEIMDRGFKSININAPDSSYYLWRLKGTDELLFAGNGQAAQKSMQIATDWAKQVNNEESRRVAEISQTTANFLAKNPKSKRAQFAAWMMVIDNAVDSNVKKIAVRKIQEIGGKVEIDNAGKVNVTPPLQD